MKKEMQQIEVRVNGDVKLVNGITKTTTCSDVITILAVQLGRLDFVQHSFAIFESKTKTERQLPGRTKVLKVLRGWGSDKEGYELVLRQVERGVKSTKLQSFKQKLMQLRGKRIESKSDEKRQRTDDLADMVKIQRCKLESLQNMNLNHSKDTKGYKKCILVNQTTDSMRNFMTKVDRENMADFLNFCCLVYKSEKQPTEDTVDENVDFVQEEDSCVTDKLNEACFMDQREGKREILKRFFSSHKPFRKSSKKSVPRGTKSRDNDDELKESAGDRNFTVTMESDSDYYSTDLDEAFVEEDFDAVSDCSRLTDNDEDDDDDDDSDVDDMNECQSEEEIIEIIMNASFCLSESDEGWSSIGSEA